MPKKARDASSRDKAPDLAFITPNVLTWALNRSTFTRAEIAHRLNVGLTVLQGWETNPSSHPPFSKTEELASLLRVPLGTFFLPAPFDPGLPVPDRRSLRREYNPSPEFLELLNDVLLKQDWYRDFATATKKLATLPFVGKYDIADDEQVVATNIRDTLGLTRELRNSVGSWSEYVSTISRQAEDAGILVMRSSVVGNAATRRVDLKELMGFALSDPVAPLVFVNTADYKASQVFTLAHEIAHLWIGQSAIDTPDPTVLKHKNATEDFVNRVATAVLVPPNEFLAGWKSEHRDRRLMTLSRRFWVSTLVVLRRARELEQIDDDEFYELKAAELAKITAKKKGGGGDFYRNLVVRMGAKFTYSVLGEVNGDRLALMQASRLLGVKVKTLVTFAEMVK